jgi:hypothetical protein
MPINQSSSANSIYVNNSDVYVTVSSGGAGADAYWKNDVGVVLTDHGAIQGMSALTVSSGKVYVSGIPGNESEVELTMPHGAHTLLRL